MLEMGVVDTSQLDTLRAAAERGDHIGLLLGSAATDADFLAAHALKERLGEQAHILNVPATLRERWGALFTTADIRKEVALILDVEKNPVDELRYEKEGSKLRILLTPRSSISKDAFDLEERYSVSDIIVAFGFSSREELERTIREEAPVKDVHAVITIASAAPAPVQRVSAPSEALENAPAPRRTWDPDAMKLWARALLRSYTEEELGTFWAFLPREDFLKTNQSSDILPDLLADMRAYTAIPDTAVILWQEPKENTERVHALVESRNRPRLEQIALASSASIASSHIMLTTFPNFSEAELEVRKLLKRTL